MKWYEWYIKCVTTDYFKFQGRARRKEYWMFTLFSFIIYMILSIIFENIMSSPAGYTITSTIYSLAIFIPSFSVTVRRLHDTNRSGWWSLLAFIPVIGILILLIFMLLDSTPSDNNYGENPKEQQYIV
ncbi:hypothetical protein BHC47_01090 [Snodgrassella alvi]|uniref:DUF805 domain-containing protein n=1 Tax=Snodgrassella alvi TaxID=1196083 RepID=A0A2N9Y1G9_9NEIS|nr:DUF805 domain-containing protein [Snodgrassella alvi]PIT60489.1 hypothetical protein BHC47_01090 [Snodgrassella alvi]